LSNEQWRALLDMLNNQKASTSERMTGKRDNLHWIIDSGATNHMIGDLKSKTCEKFQIAQLGYQMAVKQWLQKRGQ